MAKEFRDPATDIKEYHAHIYFSEGTKPSAMSLYREIQKRFEGKIHLNSVAEGPRGPHVPCMFGLDIPKAQLESVLGFLLINHGPHSVLFHPVTENELMDHTHYALWLGMPQPLNLSVLA